MIVIKNIVNSLKTESVLLNTLAAFGLYEFFRGLSFEVASIIFKGDSINIPGINIDININRFMKHTFIFLFILFFIIMYKMDDKENSKKTGGKKKQKTDGKKKKIKFVKNM